MGARFTKKLKDFFWLFMITQILIKKTHTTNPLPLSITYNNTSIKDLFKHGKQPLFSSFPNHFKNINLVK